MKNNFTVKVNLRPHPKELLLEKKEWGDKLVCFWDSENKKFKKWKKIDLKMSETALLIPGKNKKTQTSGSKVEVLYY